MKVRIIQYWVRNPETGERVDTRYNLQQEDENGQWHDVPVFDMEVKIEDRKDEGPSV
jgi:redox-sensitive bicupin YhaK (pirin superfamily)